MLPSASSTPRYLHPVLRPPSLLCFAHATPLRGLRHGSIEYITTDATVVPRFPRPPGYAQMERLAMARMGFLDKAREVEVSTCVCLFLRRTPSRGHHENLENIFPVDTSGSMYAECVYYNMYDTCVLMLSSIV